MRKFMISVMFLFVGLSFAGSYAADQHPDDQALATDTVICLKNAMGGQNVSVLMYGKFMNNMAYSGRNFALADGKTVCLRYTGLSRMNISFYNREELKRGIRQSANDYHCERPGRRSATFFLLGYDETGKKSCISDTTKTDAEIREYVRGKKALTK